jgi:hypothetical protein
MEEVEIWRILFPGQPTQKSSKNPFSTEKAGCGGV